MSLAGASVGGGLLGRARNILVRPASEWDAIEAEPASFESLYLGYACVLATIPAVALVLGSMLLGRSWIVPMIVLAALTYGLQLAGLLAMALAIDALAPRFQARPSRVQAMKLAVYSATPIWLVGALDLIPAVGFLAAFIGLLYGLYLAWLGLPKLMAPSAEKRQGYVLASLGVVVLIALVLWGAENLAIAPMVPDAAAASVSASAPR
ncbi:MAG: DUF1282 family protein [Caulobacteraceae bacterium]|nr:DUF1282 family protein [Caulobacteraceae bacterium]